jgi:sec-independent protein translocase protein TatA
MNTLAMGMPGPTELMLIFAIVLVLFGAKKLPELAKGLGQSMREFHKTRDEFTKEFQAVSQDVKGTPVRQPVEPVQQIQAAPEQTAPPVAKV